MLRVYLDGIIVLNFLVDYLLLLGTNRLTGFPPGGLKTVGAAFLGGLYGGACLLPGFRFLSNTLWRLIFLCLMAMLAFGWGRTAIHRGAIFILLSMALGGIASGLEMKDFLGIILCGGMLWLLCRMGFPGGQGTREYIPVELNWGGKKLRIVALRDTGNTLRDPLTGEAVLVCGADVGEELLGIPKCAFADPTGTIAVKSLPGFRLIPYRTVGQPMGMLLALRLNDTKIGGKERNPLVAFAPQEIGKGEGYRMLTGGMV